MALWAFYEKTLTERLRNLVIPRRSVMKEDPSSFIILACADDICDDVQRFSTRTHMCVFSCLKLLRSRQHAVSNGKCFLVGFHLSTDIQHCRDSTTNLIVFHVQSMLRIVYNSFRVTRPLTRPSLWQYLLHLHEVHMQKTPLGWYYLYLLLWALLTRNPTGRLIEPEFLLLPVQTCKRKRRFATTLRSLHIVLGLLHTFCGPSGRGF